MLSSEPRVRFWKPATDLQPYVGNYHLYAVVPEKPGTAVEAVFFPGSATLRFKLTPASRWQARFRDDAVWQELSDATLFGPSDGVTWSRTTQGIAVGIGLTARGMAQLLMRDAASSANRVVPADGELRFETGPLLQALRALDADADIAPLLDRVLGAVFGAPHPAEISIARIEAALADPGVREIGAIAARVGMSERTLQRFCARHFGFGPAALLRRTRFLRSLSAINIEPRGQRIAAIDERYGDYSHFIRDAHHFLGHSPEDFLRRLTSVERAAMLARAAIIGQQMHGLSESGEGLRPGD